MLQIAPKHWYSWDVTATDESGEVADIATSWWREKGTLTVDGQMYRAYREAPTSGAFVLEHAGSVLARAEKPSIARREFVIHHAGREFILRARSRFRRVFVLLEGSGEVGRLAPRNAFTRTAAADFPRDLPLPVRAFIVWLTMIAWRRAQDV